MKRTERTENGLVVMLSHYQSMGREWAAEITDFDPKYGFKRGFINPVEKDWSSSEKTGLTYFKLEKGKVYEVCEPSKGRWFVQVADGDYNEITKEDVKEYLEQKGSGQIDTELKSISLATSETIYEPDENGVLRKMDAVEVQDTKATYMISQKKSYIVVQQLPKGYWKVSAYIGGVARFSPKHIYLETRPDVEGKTVQEVLSAYALSEK
jgi:hypothetical protein